MDADDLNPVSRAVAAALDLAYDQVVVKKERVLHDAAERGLKPASWEEYQRTASFTVMDDLADAHIRNCKISVSGLGAAAGFGGLVAAIPDALQFVTLTLRMVTGIAASYGFDPDPDAQHGRTKLLVLQAYANANLRQAAYKGGEAVALSAATRLFRTAAARSRWLPILLRLIGLLIGLRLTRGTILRAIPIVSSGINAGFNWRMASQIAASSRKEFKQFRDDLRLGKYRDDPAYEGLGH